MAREYIIEGAEISCQFGQIKAGCTLKPALAWRAKAGGKVMGTAADVLAEHLPTGFRSCRSGILFGDRLGIPMGELVTSHHQLANASVNQTQDGGVLLPCQYSPAFGWQNAHAHVRFYGAKALLEHGWTLCQTGFGIVSIVTSGQSEHNVAQTIGENLRELVAEIDWYMKVHGIPEKHRDGLLDSALLWNGYLEMPWEYKSTKENREFCAYLEKENPELFNFFERGLYLTDNAGQEIDLTYMMGIYKTKSQGQLGQVTGEMIADNGMLNGYLEAMQMAPGMNTSEVLSSFLTYYESPEYDAEKRYEQYQVSLKEKKALYRQMEEMEGNLHELQYGHAAQDIYGSYGTNGTYDPGTYGTSGQNRYGLDFRSEEVNAQDMKALIGNTVNEHEAAFLLTYVESKGRADRNAPIKKLVQDTLQWFDGEEGEGDN